MLHPLHLPRDTNQGTGWNWFRVIVEDLSPLRKSWQRLPNRRESRIDRSIFKAIIVTDFSTRCEDYWRQFAHVGVSLVSCFYMSKSSLANAFFLFYNAQILIFERGHWNKDKLINMFRYEELVKNELASFFKCEMKG